MRDRELLVEQYRALILRQDIDKNDMKRCKFTIASDTVYVGFTFFKIDVESLKQQSPVLYQYVKPYIDNNNRVGYLEPPSSPNRAFFLVDTEHQQLAYRALARLTPESGPSI